MKERLRMCICRGLLFAVVFMATGSVTAEACRFYVAAGDKIPPKMVQAHMRDFPNALKSLGDEYADGWSVAFFLNEQGVVFRGEASAAKDDKFDTAVEKVSSMESGVVIGHLRRASSGCVNGLPNPHPFERYKMGKHWLFGHNGGVHKRLLIELIGDEYLNANLPVTCLDNPPDSWIDSELMFVYFLKMIEEYNGDVGGGLKAALVELYKAVNDKQRAFNFFLSDGETVWTFRKGNTLYYAYDENLGITAVSSMYPDEDQNFWTEFPEDMIGVIKPNEEVRFIHIFSNLESHVDFSY